MWRGRPRAGPTRHQKFLAGGFPVAGCWIDDAGGHQKMHVQMRAHGAIPGMEHADQADRAAEPLRIARQRLQGVSGGLKQ